MDKNSFEKYARDAAQIILFLKGLRYDFAVVSKNYFMEARVRSALEEEICNASPEIRQEIAQRRLTGIVQQPICVDASPIFDVEPDLHDMLKYWLESAEGYERGLIAMDNETKVALDALVEEGVATVDKGSKDDGYQLLLSKTGNKLHVYDAPKDFWIDSRDPIHMKIRKTN
jgi:hypothetical protein